MKYLQYIIIMAFLFLSGCSRKESNINKKASLTVLGDLPENPLLFSPVTFSINPAKHTMSTLYGNQSAIQHARINRNGLYPEGAVLYEVTWRQKADSLWYGANIPNQIIQVERVLFTRASQPQYEIYTGNPLRKIEKQTLLKTQRIAFILSQRMAFTP